MIAKWGVSVILAGAVLATMVSGSVVLADDLFVSGYTRIQKSDDGVNRQSPKDIRPEEESKIAPTGHAVVSPAHNCLDQLSPEEATEIRKNYERVWQECQKRLKRKKAEDQAQVEKENRENSLVIENYARVQKDLAKQDVAEPLKKEKPKFIQRLFRLE